MALWRNRLVALAIVVAGAVAGFAIYTFGWREAALAFPAPSVTKSGHVHTLRRGDVIRVPAAATRCEVSGEAGIPNLFCERMPVGRYEVVFYTDSFLVWSGPDKAVSYSWQVKSGPTVRPLTLVATATPRFPVPRYDTTGTFPQVRGGKLDLKAVNAALREAVLADQRAYAPGARKYARTAGRDCRGVYWTSIDLRLLSASTVVVSGLIPAQELYPCGNDGNGWLSVTVEVPSGSPVALGQLFRDPLGDGLPTLGAEWLGQLSDWQRRCVIGHLSDYAPTLTHYRYFALTPRGLALGFWQEPACNRLEAVVPYSKLRPVLSKLGARLVAGVRPPR